ncbi:hypothetical protein ACFYUY_04645 [Kitasatospora sp. NPDC004745]|uniref:hypothetical protein n=1 Tax=Kitasatospora sp. NPDC004745 TaxID=3364019 RepID=UPI0036935EAB
MPNPLDELAARIAALEVALPELSRASRLSHSSIDDGALTVTAAGRLRAIIGQQPDGTTAITAVNGPVPPVPTAPTATPTLGGVRVTWDGTFAVGAPSPLDLARVEVHASTTSGFVPSPATLVTTIDTPQGGIVTVPTSVPVWVTLAARTTSGKASGPSAAVTSGPAPVVAQQVLAGIVGELQLAASAVTAAKIAAAAIDGRAIADAAVTATKIGQAAVTAGKIAQDAVTTGTVAVDAITAREIAAGSITAAELAAGSVTTAALTAGAVTAGQLAAGAVTTEKLAAGAVAAGKLAADSVTAGTIAAGTVTGREIKAQAITADKIAVNSITATQLAAGAVTATALSAGAIDGMEITGTTVQTARTGARVKISPAPALFGNRPTVLMYAGLGNETEPGGLILNTLGSLVIKPPKFGSGTPSSLTIGSASDQNDISLRTPRMSVLLSELFDGVSINVASVDGSRSQSYDFGDRELSVGEWQDLVFADGVRNFGWRPVQYRRMPDGTCVLRGLAIIPGGFPNGGLIGTIADAACRPSVIEVFRADNESTARANIFVNPDGRIQIKNATGALGGWISFGHTRWFTD